jgi:hypothetical protein
LFCIAAAVFWSGLTLRIDILNVDSGFRREPPLSQPPEQSNFKKLLCSIAAVCCCKS